MRTLRFLRRLGWVGLFLAFPSVPAIGQPATVFATGLQAPIKIRLTPVGNLLVAEGGTGPNTGRISLVSRTGVTRAYGNPINTPFAPIQDTAAFTCP